MMNRKWTPRNEDINASIEVVSTCDNSLLLSEALQQLDWAKFEGEVSLGGTISNDLNDRYVDTLKEYMEVNHILPIIITSEDTGDITALVCSPYHSTAVVSNMLPPQKSEEKDYATYIGIQEHFNSSMSDIDPDRIVRLSDVRYKHDRAEVRLRNIDTAIIDLSAIRSSDNSEHSGSWPTGMTIEETCQIAQYIGASTRLKAVIIKTESKTSPAAAKNTALIMWYLCNGYKMRQAEKQHQEVNTYMIYADNIDTELVFTENKHSGRWWLQVPNSLGEEEHMTIPCTADDYKSVCKDEIPDRILRLCAL